MISCPEKRMRKTVHLLAVLAWKQISWPWWVQLVLWGSSLHQVLSCSLSGKTGLSLMLSTSASSHPQPLGLVIWHQILQEKVDFPLFFLSHKHIVFVKRYFNPFINPNNMHCFLKPLSGGIWSSPYCLNYSWILILIHLSITKIYISTLVINIVSMPPLYTMKFIH